jgi:pyruvate formate lyase activating enzyme
MTRGKPTNGVGRIFDVQRFSLHDGPGIRTVVFMKGCPLSCLWCHNPEGIASKPRLSYIPERCVGCGRCVEVCSAGAHAMDGHRHVFNRLVCESCGSCARDCYANALEVAGRDVTVEDVLKEVLRDLPFYETSGGGVTLSGGEPLFQPEFCEALLVRAKQAGLHTCVETCGYCEVAALKRISPLVDLFLYDWKETDPRLHLRNCGVSNEGILSNLRALHDAGAHVLLRCPIIPGINDRPDHFQGIAGLVKAMANVTGVELMAYHRLGESKLNRFGLSVRERLQAEAPEPELMKRWAGELRSLGVNPTTGQFP